MGTDGATTVSVVFGVSFNSSSTYSAVVSGTATSAMSVVSLTQTGFTVGGAGPHSNIKFMAIGQ